MNVVAWAPSKSGFYRGMHMRRVVVDNQVNVHVARNVLGDMVEERNELLMAMSALTLAEHASVTSDAAKSVVVPWRT